MRAPPPFSRAQSPARDSPESLPSADLSSLNFSFGQYPTTHTSFPFDQPFANSPSTVDRIFDVDSDIPRPEILDQLYPIFFSKMGCHFPFLSLASLKALDSDDPSTRVNAYARFLFFFFCRTFPTTWGTTNSNFSPVPSSSMLSVLSLHGMFRLNSCTSIGSPAVPGPL